MLFALVMIGQASAADYWAGIQAGYRGGAGGELNAGVSDFAQGFPMALRFAVGYSVRDAGNAADARRIFVNDATDGTPEENGSFMDYRFDLMYHFQWRTVKDLRLSGGVRYAQSTSHFKYIGGNEDFEVTGNQWGLGAGLEGHFPITKHVDFTIGAGIDYFFKAALTGHSRTYSPDGDDVDPREDYTYDDADAAINQPSLVGRALIGLSYAFGR
jgi:hypothetical protein